MLHKKITDIIIGAYYDVYNELGYGFLEKIYQNAFYLELVKRGLKIETQKQIKVFYKGKEVGVYYADLVIEDIIILELKAAEYLTESDECQLINYLRGTDIELGILFNFGKKPEFRRKIFENENKIRLNQR